MNNWFLFTLSVLMPTLAHATPGAWLQEAGKWQTISTLSAYQSNEYWDAAGNRQSSNRYRKYELAPYAEYGLTDKFTVGGTAFLQRVEATSGSAQGLAEAEVFLRAKLYNMENGVVAIQPLIKFPGSLATRSPALGSQKMDAGLSLITGYNYTLFDVPLFAEAEAGYRHRLGSATDQARANVSLGAHVNEDWTLLAQQFGTISISRNHMQSFTQSPADDYDLSKLQLSAIYHINDQLGVQAGVSKDVVGRNTGAGHSALIAIWREFLMRKLGSLLAEKKMVDEATLADALHTQTHTGSRLGDILVANGAVKQQQLYKVIAEHFGLDTIDLLQLKPDATLLHTRYLKDYIRLKSIPWRKEGDTLVVASAEPSEALDAFLVATHGANYRLLVTSPRDIRLSLEQRFAEHLTHASVEGLFELAPQASAKKTLLPIQRACMVALAVGFGLGLWISIPATALFIVAMMHMLYAGNTLLKTHFTIRGIRLLRKPKVQENILPFTLPSFTILVPLFKEAASLPGLLAALNALDYPKDKLDIKLVLEANDEATIHAAKALKPACHIDIICVPYSLPQTKPKALNYALNFARGDIVTIYDAEDRPEPNQLRKVVQAFLHSTPDVVCVQARLKYDNAQENWLTRFFALEYDTLFGPILHGVEGTTAPIPLGGTSNHVLRSALQTIGEWDAYNVTEDADLGMRLHLRGFQTVMIDSITYEEAPITLYAWIKQRSRWVKGHMQTWMVHMREPSHLHKRLRTFGTLGFHCLMGMSWLTFLTAPLIWALTLGAAFHPSLAMVNLALPWLMPFAILNLAGFFLLHWLQAFHAVAAHYARKPAFYVSAALFPFYWLLHSIASYRALFQLAFKPHYWDKTTHALSRVRGNVSH